jgi:hypothetical protein
MKGEPECDGEAILSGFLTRLAKKSGNFHPASPTAASDTRHG